MSGRVKRTYNLRASTVQRVRELADGYGVSGTQDGIIELAVERLYLEARSERDAEAWSTARDDPDFQAEMAALSRDLRDTETWPA